jgi:hypothetical protein
MRKVLVFLLTLGFAASAFALDLGNGLTVTGEVKTGFGVQNADDGKDDTENTTANFRNNDADQGFRGRVTFGYTGDWGGAKIRLQSDGIGGPAIARNATTLNPAAGGGGTFYLNYAYGWANFLDSKIVLSGGKIGDDLWGLGKLSINAFDPSLDAITGVRAEFKLVDGLSFGFGLPFDQVAVGNYEKDAESWTYNPTTGDPVGTTVSKNRTLAAFFGGAVFGALFKSDPFSAAIGAKLNPALDGKVFGALPDTDTKKYGTTPAYVDIIAGAEVHPIDPLKVVVDARIDTRKFDKAAEVRPFNQVGYARIGLKAQYATGPLTAYLKGSAFLPNSKADEKQQIDGVPVANADFAGIGKPGGYAYADSALVKYLGDPSFAVELSGTYTVGAAGIYFNVGSDNVAWIAGDGKLKINGEETNRPGAGIYVKPGVKFTLGTTSIEIFDKVNRIGAAELPATSTTKARSPISNTFQIDFNWSF